MIKENIAIGRVNKVTDIDKVDAKNIVPLKEFQTGFKKEMVDKFTGKKAVDFQGYVLEKF